MGDVALSSQIEKIQDHYTVVVVGSGYGGGIAASRLARAGQRVCLLERGKEIRPGSFPRSWTELPSEVQVDCEGSRKKGHNGLFDLRLFPEINVVVGCGLGGTSLINANVSIEADRRVLEDVRWPAALRDDRAALDEGYRRAREMLVPTETPDHVTPAKTAAHQHSAAVMEAPWRRTAINVTFDKPTGWVNHVGVEQSSCVQCGDCVTGCNARAKNTTLMNYLPDAANHGAEIFTEVEVRRVSRDHDGRYAVHYRIAGAGREAFDAPEQWVTADVVVLAAGTLGSTEILLRSQRAGLTASSQIGRGFTGNGDVLGFGYNGDHRVNGIGAGTRRIKRDHDGNPVDGVGPCITSVIDLRATGAVNDGMIIEDGSIPAALSAALPGALAVLDRKLGVRKPRGFAVRLSEKWRELVSIVAGPHHGATQHTQIYLVMGHEHTTGTMRLDEQDELALAWQDIGEDPRFQRINDRLTETAEALGGSFVRDPLWIKPLHDRLTTVHPLGGCILADDAERGVVNHKGQVFSDATGTAVHAGLYVADGSVIPRSLGCNPLLTISAIAERTCALIAADRGWTIDYTLPSRPPPRAPATTGLEFTERMAGQFSTRVVDDFRAAEAAGRSDDSPFELVVTIVAEDLERLLHDDSYRAGILGTARAPALSPEPLTITAGHFTLLAHDADRIDARTMRYRMKLTAADGRHFWFEGDKHVADDPGLDLWPDTTTLYITITEGSAPGGAVVGRGILHITPADFLRQLRTTRALRAGSRAERLAAVARFGAHFAGDLFDVYGGIFAGATAFDPAAPPRSRRPLRAPAPELYPFLTNDGAALRLTRYRAGARGPVVLAHGLGVSSRIFTVDTIDTNLVEFLCAHDFDVWLLDYRASIDLPAHRTRYTADAVARHDFPAAVARILAATGAPTVQVVAHCFGATTFTMAMLAGLTGVRSAVLSQIAAHITTPLATHIKTGLHIPDVLDALGVSSLTAYVDRHADWQSRLLDTALRLYPVGHDQHCRSPVCHHISFLYAPLYQHTQLAPATHDTLHELFGDAAITAFEHLARLSRTGHLVSADGADLYMPHLARLAIPITFLHGAANACFLPRSTEDTRAALSAANGPGLYRRHLIPDYGHIDCIFGKHASRDVYPHILEHLVVT